ncbi:tetratricopeptide repeat protein [Gigaspora margarita]|uniref:Tetratricopeptide repeat protein n=1 Tax=Gigaspora margarita TaxID=4874 RepID=A0A8H4A7K5_GIGMA|nr:tetratricopeptide repeat protein [Gigaspora margarita]
MAFSIDNYDIFNYISNVQEDEINLGISYLKLGHYFDSLDQFKKYANALTDAHRSLEIESTSLGSFILRGETYFMLGKFNEALTDFNKALEINPNNKYVLTLSGEIYLKFQLYGKALICLKIASEFDHNNTESLVHCNNALQKLINTLLFHGESFYSLKQYDEALLYYDKVLEVDPFNLIATSFVGKYIIH